MTRCGTKGITITQTNGLHITHLLGQLSDILVLGDSFVGPVVGY